jgi:type I restriction enzyme S subunit
MGDLANPGAVPSVNEGQMRDTPAAAPPKPEQRAIAAFLDRKAARIDALIAKVREAIKRLKELRFPLGQLNRDLQRGGIIAWLA